jgi:hypothetical protein
MGGRWHTVVPGDCLASLAERYGVPHERDIYEHGENAGLRRGRASPYLLRPGDRVYIPLPEGRGLRCTPQQTNRFRGRPRRRALRVQLERRYDEPLSGVRYELEVGDETFEGTTGDDGVVCHDVRVGVRDGTLTLHEEEGRPPRVMRLAIGHLDPANTESGQGHRLRNLGFRDDERGIRDFQRAAGVDPTGVLDDETVRALQNG